MRKCLVCGILIICMAGSFVACSGEKKDSKTVSEYMIENNVAGEYKMKDSFWALSITEDYFSIYDPVGNPGVEGRVLSMDDKSIVVEVDKEIFDGFPAEGWSLSGDNLEVEYERTEDTITLTNSGVPVVFISDECGTDTVSVEIAPNESVKKKDGSSVSVKINEKETGKGGEVVVEYQSASIPKTEKIVEQVTDFAKDLGTSYLLESSKASYLFVQCTDSNNLAKILFVKISDDKIKVKDSLDGALVDAPQGNSVVISTPINIFGNHTTDIGYSIVDGEITTTGDQDVYTINTDGTTLKVKKEFEISDYEGNKVTVKAGSEILLYIWNKAEKYVELEANYKDECIQGTLAYTKEDDGYYIDGVIENDIFENLP